MRVSVFREWRPTACLSLSRSLTLRCLTRPFLLRACVRSGFCSSLDPFPLLLSPHQLPKNTRARTYTQTVDTAQGTFPLHTPSGAPVPVCPCTHDLVYTCILLSTCSLWSQNGQNFSDKGYQMLFWGLLQQCSLADWPTNNYKGPMNSAMAENADGIQS